MHRTDGASTFVVDGSEQVSKKDLPLDRIWIETEASALRLITCGGEYDPTDRRLPGQHDRLRPPGLKKIHRKVQGLPGLGAPTHTRPTDTAPPHKENHHEAHRQHPRPGRSAGDRRPQPGRHPAPMAQPARAIDAARQDPESARSSRPETSPRTSSAARDPEPEDPELPDGPGDDQGPGSLPDARTVRRRAGDEKDPGDEDEKDARRRGRHQEAEPHRRGCRLDRRRHGARLADGRRRPHHRHRRGVRRPQPGPRRGPDPAEGRDRPTPRLGGCGAVAVSRRPRPGRGASGCRPR